MTDQTYEIITERDVQMPMRDGTILRADIIRPNDPGRFPVLLNRTPYGKATPFPAMSFEIAAARGYAVIAQDVRGRFASEGEYTFYRDDMLDGYDSVEWAALQPWSDGKVGMFGGSYTGATQFQAAAGAPPHLVSLFPFIAFTDVYSQQSFPGGAFSLSLSVAWVMGMMVDTVQRKKIQPTANLQAILSTSALVREARAKGNSEEMAIQNRRLNELLFPLFSHLPLRSLPIARELAPYLFEWLEHSALDSYWDMIDTVKKTERMQTPSLHLGGWYDIFSGAVPSNYCTMVANAATSEARKGQRLIMGPWTHGGWTSTIGQIDFGSQASLPLSEFTQLHLRWFDCWLKGMDNGVKDEQPVRIFVMGKNIWRNENEWPLARTEYTRYYLHGGGKANSSEGDGRLSPIVPAAESSDTFVYDPKEPVPTLGGAIFPIGQPAGVFDQRPVEARQDVLVYTSDILQEDLEVTGPLTVELWAASTAPDTDFTAKLVDVHPDGYAQNIQDGIIRARFRESFREPKLIEPGAVLKYTIDLNATSNVFLAGHRIRLEISSSNFPHYDRNPNTGHPFGEDAELAVARQTIFHDSEHPSCIILPVIPGE